MKDDDKNLIDFAVKHFLTNPTGEVVEHSRLRILANIEQPTIEDFQNQHEFLDAVRNADFQYLSFVEKLKEVLLKEHHVCLKNEKGVGYYSIPPKEQIEYGFRKAKQGIAKKVKQGRSILENVQWSAVSVNDRKQANDNSARLSMLRQMMSGR